MNEKKNLTTKEIFELAAQNHRKNNLEVAENLYKKILEKDPNHFQSICFLGTLSIQIKNFERAKKLLNKAIGIQPNNANVNNNLGIVNNELEDYQKAINCFQNALKINPDLIEPQANIASIYIGQLDNLKKAISTSYKTQETICKTSMFGYQGISLYRFKHDLQQAEYLDSKNYKINGIDEFLEIGNKIIKKKENIIKDKNFNQNILLNHDEINKLLPYYKAYYIYKTPTISNGCINPGKNWQEIEEQYFNSYKQIIYIDDFLSNEAIKELREFCLISKIWTAEYKGKYLGTFSDRGFISPIHLQIAIELRQKLPKLFGKHKLGKFWAFKYDSKLGEGINVHADFAILNLNFWITPDEYNNNKNSGGLKVYDTPAPKDWTFQKYNRNTDEIYKFLNDSGSNCKNIPYRFNRAVLFNSDYFHETDKIDFKEGYESRRINVTYLFGNRLVKKMN